MPLVYLGLGSNAGDRLAHLDRAVTRLGELGAARRSSWYETVPVDMPSAPYFLNGVVRVDTSLDHTPLPTDQFQFRQAQQIPGVVDRLVAQPLVVLT